MIPKNRQPTHPGEVLLEEFLKRLKISPEQFVYINDLIIKKEKAMELAEAFGNSPQFWINLQNQYDLWVTRHLP